MKIFFILKKEWILNDSRPSEEWPEMGQVQFIDYSVKYRTELENVLNNINADVRSGEKVIKFKIYNEF